LRTGLERRTFSGFSYNWKPGDDVMINRVFKNDGMPEEGRKGLGNR
jgi:hypothetical protein